MLTTIVQDLIAGWKTDRFKLPNLLTEARFILSPIPGILLILGLNNASFHLAAVIAFILIAATDLFDGFIARHFNQITEFGKTLDPIADASLSVLTIIALSIVNPIAWVLTIVIVLRQIHVARLMYFAKKRGMAVAVNFSGKVKTFFVTIAMILLFLQLEGVGQFITLVFVTLAVISAIISWLEYSWQYSEVQDN